MTADELVCKSWFYVHERCLVSWRFSIYFVFLIEINYFSFKTILMCRFCLYIYIYIYIYIYSTNIIQIQDKLIINYAIQTQCQTYIISKFKIFSNSQD